MARSAIADLVVELGETPDAAELRRALATALGDPTLEVALWSAEVLGALRSHRASFGSVCPDALEAFEAWWRGDPPAIGRRSILLLFDPIEALRRGRRGREGGPRER